MIHLTKTKLLIRGLIIVCLVTFMVLQGKMSVFGGSKTYIINSDDTESTPQNTNYYFYIPTSTAPGTFICRYYGNYINSASTLVPKPYPIWLKYVYTLSDPKDDGVTDNPSMKISRCTADGKIYTTPVSHTISQGATVTNYFEIYANEGVLFNYFTGRWYWKRWTKIFGFPDKQYRSFPATIQITVQYDEASPNSVPAFQAADIDGNGFYSDDGKIYYTKSNEITLEWSKATDQGSSLDSYKIISGINNYQISIYKKGSSAPLLTRTIKEDGVQKKTEKFEIPSEGEYTATIKAFDMENNVGPETTCQFVVDRSTGSVNAASIKPAVSDAKREITFTWDKVIDNYSGVDKYVVQLYDENGVSGEPKTCKDSDQPQVVFTGLSSTKTYYVKIRTVDKLGNQSSEWATSATCSLGAEKSAFISAVPVTETELGTDGNPKYSIVLTLSKADCVKYLVERQVGTNTATRVKVAEIPYDAGVTEVVYTDTKNLSKHQTYKYFLYTLDLAGNKVAADKTIEATVANWAPSNVSAIDMTGGYAGTRAFTISPSVDAEGDTICFRVMKGKKVEGQAVVFESDSDALKTGPVSVTFSEDGDWEWYLEYAEFNNGVEIADTRRSTARQSLEVDTQGPDPKANSFAIKTLDGQDCAKTNSTKVILTDFKLTDAGSGVKEIYLWNGTATTPPTDAVKLALAKIPASGIEWNLNQEGECRINCLVVDNAGLGTLITNTVILDRTAAAAPEAFSHSFGENALIFNWKTSTANNADLSKFIGSYLLPDGSIKTFETAPTSSKSGTLTINTNGLGANQPVTLRVSSLDDAGNLSGEVTYTAYTQAKPGQLKFVKGGYDTTNQRHFMEFTLSEPGVAKTHRLEYGVSNAQGFAVAGSIGLDSGGSFVHHSLANGDKLAPHQTYEYRLVALNESDDPAYGAIVSQKVPNVKPTEPVALTPKQFARGQVEFKYQKSLDFDGDVIRYRIYLRQGTDSSTEIQVTDEKVSGLIHGKTYYWYVVADDGYDGISTSQTAQFTVDTNAPNLSVEEPQRPFTNQKQLGITVSDDLSGIREVTYKKINAADNQVLAEGTITLMATSNGSATGEVPLEEGQYHLHITVYDNAGNSKACELNNLMVDRTAPELTNVQLKLPRSNGRYLCGSNQIPVSFSLTESLATGGKLRYWVVRQKQLPEEQGSVIGLGPGLKDFWVSAVISGTDGQEYYLALAAEDSGGNRSAVQYCGPILLDQSAPELNLEVTGFYVYGSALYVNSLNQLSVKATAQDGQSRTSETYTVLDAATGIAICDWASWDVVKGTTLTKGKRYQVAARSVNEVGLATQQTSMEFRCDNTAPENVTLSVPSGSLSQGEIAIFSGAAEENESAITCYRLAIGSASGKTELSALIPGNEDGWLVIRSEGPEFVTRIEIPAVDNGTYQTTLQAVNAVGLSKTINGKSIVINNNPNKVIVNDQGPYSMFTDRLTGWWTYKGDNAAVQYRYRIIRSDNQTVTDWVTTKEQLVTVDKLTLESGKTYRFEVQAVFSDGTISASAYSPGVTVDTSAPEITLLKTPRFTTSNNLVVECQGRDDQSGLARVQVALGSAYGKTDITAGWVDMSGSPSKISVDAQGRLLELEHGKRYYLTLRLINGAGLTTEREAESVIIDNTPPPQPNVVDQGAYINTKQLLEAHWLWTPVDPESGTVQYLWTLIEPDQDPETAEWNDGTASLRAKLNEASQEHGHTYIFVVKAVNGAGLSSIGRSNGITVDASAPYIPKVILLNAVDLGDPKTANEVNYITSNEGLGLWIDSLDPESAIALYYYAYGNQTNVDLAEKIASDQATIELINPAIESGEVTLFKGECLNNADLLSPAGYSTGVMLDTGAPKIINVNGSVSGNQLLFDWDWEVPENSSPVAGCKVILVSESEMNSSPTSNWIEVGLNRSLTMDASSFADGNYRLLVTAYNRAGTYSRRQAGLDEWGISPRVTLDRVKPVITDLKHLRYISQQLTAEVTATDNLSGIAGYQYALGNKENLFAYSKSWVDVDNQAGNIKLTIDTKDIPHLSELILMVRVKDQAGLWSTVKVSDMIIVDHTAPSKPVITSEPFTKSLHEINNIDVSASDAESGITHYRIGLVTEKGGEWLVSQTLQTSEFARCLTELSLEDAKMYYLAVQVKNGVGEWSEISYSDAIVVDIIKPELTFAKGDQTLVLNQPPLEVGFTVTEAGETLFSLTGADGTVKEFKLTTVKGENFFTFSESKAQGYTLIATPVDQAGNVGAAAVQKIRVNAPPQVSLPTELFITPGAPLTFNATVQDPDYVEGDVWNYQWQIELGDGETVSLTGANPTYVFSNVIKDYVVTVTVTDKDGGTGVAQTTVKVGNTAHGTLTSDEIWSGTHYIDGDVIVPVGKKLTILPGTQVIVTGVPGVTGYNHALIIQGSLEIMGDTQKVVFTSVTGSVGAWKGIYIQGSASIKGLEVQYAKRALIIVDNATVDISGSTFINNQTGIHVYNSQPVINQSVLQNNQIYGIKEEAGGRPVVTDCVFTNNTINYYHDTLTVLSIEELNQVPGNSGNR